MGISWVRTWVALGMWLLVPMQLSEAQEPAEEAIDEVASEQVIEDEDPAAPWRRRRFGGFGLPAFAFSTDEGFGFGAVGSLYRYDGETQPYRWRLGLQIYASTRGAHAHMLDVDALRLAGGKLRLTGQLRFDATKADTYCGLGGAVRCSSDEAEARADARGLTGDDRADFVRRYFLMRYMRPSALFQARYMLREDPAKVQLNVVLRASYLLPGDFVSGEPWVGSKYAEDFGAGERGSMLVAEVGVGYDTRDVEPAPSRGVWFDASLRGGVSADQDWAYFGVNTTFRGYVSLVGTRLVLADRVMFDGMIGDASTRELATPGGIQPYTLYGGERMGRGVRQRRYRGRVVLANQVELRWRMFEVPVFKAPFGVVLVLYNDLGLTGLQWADFGRSPPVSSQGAGLRFEVDRSFVVRSDVGFSAVENWQPGIYISVENLF